MYKKGEMAYHMKTKLNVKKIYCRGFQSVMKVGMAVLPWAGAENFERPGCGQKAAGGH